MHIHSRNTSLITGPSFDIGGYALPMADHVKDLGVLIDCLKYMLTTLYHLLSPGLTSYYNTKTLGTSRSCCEHSRLPIIEYASSVWSPYLNSIQFNSLIKVDKTQLYNRTMSRK